MKRKISFILAVLLISVLANFLSASGISTYSGVYKDANVLLTISSKSVYSIKRPNSKRYKSSGHTIFFKLKSKRSTVRNMQIIFNEKVYNFGKSRSGKVFSVKLARPESNYFIKLNYKIGRKKISKELITKKGKRGPGLFGRLSILKYKKSPYDSRGYKYVYNKVKNYFTLYSSSNKRIANIMFFDNGPDYYSSGLRRIVSRWGKRYGFINKKNQVVIKPRFKFAYQFKGKYAIVIKNPRFKKDGEHTAIVKGKYGVINKAGKIVIPMKYDSISQRSNKFKVVLNGKTKTIRL